MSTDFVADLAAQDSTGELEVLVADGDSERRVGGAPARAAAARRPQAEHHREPGALGLPGPERLHRRARGDLIVRLDCHSRYPARLPAPLRRAVRADGCVERRRRLVPTGRRRWSGRWPARWTARSAASAGRAPRGAGRCTTDTVTFGAFRPEAFERAGMFDETLMRNQDDEFNLRLRRAGGQIMLDPRHHRDVPCRAARSRGVCRQYYEYGLWKVPVMLKHRRVLSARASRRWPSSGRCSWSLRSAVRSSTSRSGSSWPRSASMR